MTKASCMQDRCRRYKFINFSSGYIVVPLTAHFGIKANEAKQAETLLPATVSVQLTSGLRVAVPDAPLSVTVGWSLTVDCAYVPAIQQKRTLKSVEDFISLNRAKRCQDHSIPVLLQ